jgi:hypothetical protein
MRKIWRCKFAEEKNSCTIVGACGKFFGLESPKTLCFPAKLYGRSKLCSSFECVHAFKTRGVALALTAICAILRATAFTEIFFSVIQAVSVPVINMWKIISGNNAMHQDASPFSVYNGIPGSVKRLRSFVPGGAPIESIEYLEPVRINDSNLVFSKRNQFNRLIFGLNYFLAQRLHKQASLAWKSILAAFHFTWPETLFSVATLA